MHDSNNRISTHMKKKQKNNETTIRNRWMHHYSWSLQFHYISNGQIQQAQLDSKAQPNSWIEPVFIEHSIQCLQNTSLMLTCDIHQDWSHSGYKTHLKIFNKIENMQSMFSDNNGIKLKIHNRKIARKSLNCLRLDNTLLNSWWAKWISNKIKEYLEQTKNKDTIYQKYIGCSKTSA